MKVEVRRDPKEIDAIRERLLRTVLFEKPDRTPVIAWIDPRFWMGRVGFSFSNYFSDGKTQLKAQILGQKWLIENLGDDRLPTVSPPIPGFSILDNESLFEKLTFFVQPDFQGVENAAGYGCDIRWREKKPPVIERAIPTSLFDIEKIERMDPAHDGLYPRIIKSYNEMSQETKNVTITMAGETFHPTTILGVLYGPFTIASIIRGFSTLMVDILKSPTFLHELLSVLTDKLISWGKICEELCGYPQPLILADDYGQYLSPRLYREFALPYNDRVFKQLSGKRTYHMCGDSNHILQILVNDLKIEQFWGFGYPVDLEKISSLMGGKVLLRGNLNPMTIAEGSQSQVISECRRRLESLSLHSGYILSDGANLPPETPLENIQAMVRAAEIHSSK